MQRDYSDIGYSISETGFFSEYLPPCFKINREFFSFAPNNKCDLIAPVSFTMSRFNGNNLRRNIYIPEIGSYISVHKYMMEQQIIPELIEFTETSISSFSPILNEDDMIVRHEQSYGEIEFDEISSNYIDNIAKKIARSAGAKYILKLDISNCFSSFYLHMIPAILLGVENAESEFDKYRRNKNDPSINPVYIRYNLLDTIIRRQNFNRTNGLLTGTLYSKILAEGILTRIDIELNAQGVKFSRYVDDYEVYIYNHEEERVISIFEKTLKRYGFTLNSEKTELVGFPYYLMENLEHIFRSQYKEIYNNSDIMILFNTFISLEKAGTTGAIRYLLNTIEANPIDVVNDNLYKSYLLTILGNNARSLTKACSILINCKDKLGLMPDEVTYIAELLTLHLDNGHDLEAIWLLYLLIQTESITKDSPIVSLVASSNNELAQLLLLQKALLTEELLTNISARAVSWILLYELFASNYISESTFKDRLNLRYNLSMYKDFSNHHFHFCDFGD